MKTDPSQLGNEVTAGIIEIGRFVESPAFEKLLLELRAVPVEQRVEFVKSVVLNQKELAQRGIRVPVGLVIQRSYFADNRPTLFCVSKKLNDGKWKVTITFDEDVYTNSLPLAMPPS